MSEFRVDKITNRDGSGFTPGITNAVDYVTIATTGNASDFGDLTSNRAYMASFSNAHGGL